jgi:hydrogenase maturation protease
VYPRHVQLLVIGYGNELRRDDAVGPKVAASIAVWKLPDVQTLVCQQLTPELADPIASAGRVIFVDASVGAGDLVQVRDIEPNSNFQIITHAADPHCLLALAKQTFGRCPPASWLSIPVQDLDFGDELSPLALKGMEVALEKLRMIAEAASRLRTNK